MGKSIYPADIDASAEVEQLRREHAALQKRVSDLSNLIDIGVIINSTYDLDDLIRLVMEKAQLVMHAEASSVMIINSRRNVLECPVALGEAGEKIQMIELQIGQGIAGHVAKSGQPEIIGDVYADPRFNPQIDAETGFRTRTILAAPLLVKDKIIGVAEVINRLDGQPFDQADLDLFLAFCRPVAMAVQSARVLQLEMEQQRLDQQLDAAKFIQQSFMPENIPQDDGQPFAVAAKSLAARAVGGDFYDFICFDEQNIGVIIGDISGKGIPAALFMARVISDFRLHTQKPDEPGRVLTALNSAVNERSQRGMFVTSLYGILNSETGGFRFANAGHIPLIHFNRAEQRAVIVPDISGVPLGILPHYNYEQEQVRLEHGDYLLMITDGVTEAKGPDGSEYSLQRVLDLFTVLPDNADAMVDLLITDIREFTGDNNWHDDVTIVALNWF